VIGCLAPLALAGAAAWSRAAEPAKPAAASPGPASTPARFARDVVPFLTKHCYACHGKGKKKADLALDVDQDEHSIEVNREVWETVLEMIRTGEMPPKPRPRPGTKETDKALEALDAVLAALDCDGPRNVGRVTLRRLNRTEYNNTIRDLVGVDFKPAADFPNDDVGYGFDNIGDVLSLSPLLFEKYLAAAETILDQAVVIADPPKPSENRLSSLRASFGAGGPATRRRGMFLTGQGRVSGESYVDEGDYIIRADVHGNQLGDEPVRAAVQVDREPVQEFEVKASDPGAPTTLEARVRLKAGTRNVGVAFLNPYTPPGKDGDAARAEPPRRRFGADPQPADPPTDRRVLIVRNIVLDGPYNPPPPVLPESHRRIMAHEPGLPPREAARAIVTRFATRAFRRPVRPAEVDRLMALYDEAVKDGDRFENGVRVALGGVLVWPHFLFRVELDPEGAEPGASYPINEYELASRLSYFLWSTMPDETLFELAARGKLREDLPGQVRRMLADPKASAFVENFVGQWLTTRKLAYVVPDPETFPGFDDALRAAMVRETELFFEAVLRENRSVMDLLDADFSFVNERLARHYGIGGVAGQEFRRVSLPPNRGGILTQASILTLTSNPTRTSPVKRGKWVLEQILGTPPPPPPPDVPELPPTKQLTGSLRKVMEQHRENALCASCHNRMDPIGFAFENYDAIGSWRDKEAGGTIDASGVLPDGVSFRGPAELKAILKGTARRDDFRRCLAEKMLTYAMGRGLEYYDRCAVDTILETLDKTGDTMSSLIEAVVRSEPFQMRTATGEGASTGADAGQGAKR
jgi:hypothetical protein